MSDREPLRLEDARERMLVGLAPLTSEIVPIGDALGRVLTEDAVARVTLPPWDNSAMDGYAVRAADVTGAGEARPVRLRVVGESAAGHAPDAVVIPGTAVRVLTGAMLPQGADAVVPVEDTNARRGVAELPDSVAVHRSAEPGAHVRRRGSDLVAGERLADAGMRLAPAILAVLAAGGLGEVRVHRRPRIAILGTGDELVSPGMPLGPAQIPDSNTVALAALARAAGAEVVALGIACDQRDEVIERLRDGIERADVVVASGGVSVGAHDEVKEAFDVVGRMDLWRVAIQPGKPLAFGRAQAPDGRTVLLFGLPGNPVSSFVTFELFVRPVVRRLAGHLDPIGRRTVRARLTADVTTSPGRRAFLRVRIVPDRSDSSLLTAELAGGQGSHVLSALARANGLAIIPEEVDALPAGSVVDVLRIDEEPQLMPIDPTAPSTRRDRRRLTHVDRHGRPRMVDVSEKPVTARRAVAEAWVYVEHETLSLVIDGAGPKGDVLTVAELAGVMGAKRTADLIPLCHPIPLTDLGVEMTPDRSGGRLRIKATASTTAQTGVEMEAMTACAVAALTVYDMVKGADRTAEIRNLRLLEKSGGKSGEWRRPADPEGGDERPRRPVPKGARGPQRRG